MPRITSAQPSSISLNGFIGEFKTPGSNYSIKFFSTVANNSDSGYQSFLKKLEPLRDKVSPASIKDLGSLLQRDLSDIRIANDLVPYILNKENNPSHIAFFPSVLCVLMPKDFLSDSNKEDMLNNAAKKETHDVKKYPKPNERRDDDGNLIKNYSNGWEILEYYEGSERTRLGKISIFDEMSDFLVLDGQHRTNAFRAASGEFPKPNTIYQTFYNNPASSRGSNALIADLSVTLIWFETTDDIESPIKPDLISRKLFIDVNNSAKSISKSRMVLLNDSSPNNLITRFFYSYLSRNFSFSLSKLSLFHFGFDYPEDLASKKSELCPLNLFNPEIIDAGIDWMLFLAKDKYSIGKVSASRLDNNDLSSAESYLNDNPFYYFEISQNRYGEQEKRVLSTANLILLEKKSEGLNQLIYDLLNGFPLVGIHVEATKQLNELYESKMKPFDTSTPIECFEKAYLGGEGIYYSIKKLNNNSSYYLAITQDKKDDLGIDQTFYSLRHNQAQLKGFKLKEINSAYNRLSTLVFAPGYLVAFIYFAKEINLSQDKAKDEFIKRLNSIEIKNWISFLTIYLDEMFENDLTPKAWPIFSNMLIRQIQKENEFFDTDNLRLSSPELYIIKNKFKTSCDEYRNDKLEGKNWMFTSFNDFPTKIVDEIIFSSIKHLDGLFEKIGLVKDSKLNYSEICKESLRKRCKKI